MVVKARNWEIEANRRGLFVRIGRCEVYAYRHGEAPRLDWWKDEAGGYLVIGAVAFDAGLCPALQGR